MKHDATGLKQADRQQIKENKRQDNGLVRGWIRRIGRIPGIKRPPVRGIELPRRRRWRHFQVKMVGIHIHDTSFIHLPLDRFHSDRPIKMFGTYILTLLARFFQHLDKLRIRLINDGSFFLLLLHWDTSVESFCFIHM